MGSAPEGGGPPGVPGYDLGPPVGFGANGPVWSAHDRRGHAVVVNLLPLGGQERSAAQLRRIASLRSAEHPHLGIVVDVVLLDDGRAALVSVPVPGPSLATVVAARGRLRRAELAQLMTALGGALGHLHERGVVHGDLSPANVLVAPGGVPVLVDLAGEVSHERGTPGFVAPERLAGGVASPAGDVWALARLIHWCAQDDAAVGAILAPALSADPRARPSARALETQARSLAPASRIEVPLPADLAQARLRAGDAHEPTRRVRSRYRPEVRHGSEVRQRLERRQRPKVRHRPGDRRRPAVRHRLEVRNFGPVRRRRGGGGRRTDRPRPGRRRGERRTRGSWARGAGAFAGGIILGLTVTTAGLGLASPAAEDARTVHAPGTAPAATTATTTAVVEELLTRRDNALVAGDATALATVTVPGTPAARADARLLDTLRATGVELRGLRTELVDLSVREQVADGVVVDAVLEQQAHSRTDSAPSSRGVATQPRRCVQLELAGPKPWRLVRAEPCAVSG